MSYLANISFRRGIAILVAVLAVLVVGTWTTIKLTTDHLLDRYATAAARDWARYLAENVPDLQEIAAGEQPSAASMAFFRSTRQAGQVFRYIIFNRDGYSQLVSDRDKIALVDLSEFSPEAARAIAQDAPIVDVRRGTSPDFPTQYAEAFVPARVGNRPVAVVAAYVDQTETGRQIYTTFLLAAVTLCGLTGLSFGVPAIAWYRRTKEKQQADRRIRFLAHHDALTGLTNRGRLIERLQAALARGGQLAVHFIDIDHFKEVNDTLGHDGGDFLLKTLAERLIGAVRIDDLVARLGGDEFVIVQRDITDRRQAEDFANRLIPALAAPMYFKEQEITVNVTIGVALAPVDGNTPERLLKSADIALYNGKAAGRNCVRFFAPEMDAALQARLRLEKIIRDAVTHERFVLHYQPVFEMNGKRLVGFEALVRLPDPEDGLIPPATFIPIAEELRLIDKIGAWVLHEACRTAAMWPKNLTVAVNLSPAQFEGGNITGIVSDALKVSGLEPHRLELEITETLLLGNSERTMAQLRELKALGLSIVMDDFGTGYSSLSYLWQFPFDKIKIDRSFMEGFEKSGRDVETVVKTIIALGRELRMRVTVEGVETANQVDFLYDADADQVQGFFFGRPVPAAEVSVDILAELRNEMAAGDKDKAPPSKPAAVA